MLPRMKPTDGIPTETAGRRRPRTPLLIALLLVSWAMALATAAAQESLYGPEAPSDVAFLRVINASAAPIFANVAGGDERELLPGEASEYVPAPSSEVRFEVRRGEDAEPEAAAPDEVGSEDFVTLLVTEGELRPLEDEVLRDISRGLLAFVNASDTAPLSLRLEDGTVVFEEVGEEPASRTIAEAEAAFEVVDTSSGEVVGRIERRTIERGTAHTILAYDGPEGLAVSYLAASLAD